MFRVAAYFSTQVECETEEQATWLVQELSKDTDDFGRSCGVEIQEDNKTVWLYSECANLERMAANMERMAEVLCEFQTRFKLRRQDMSDKIKTGDCIKAICDHWQKAISEGQPLPVGRYHGAPDDLVEPKKWKRVKKFGNAKDGFVRLFSNHVVDYECGLAGAMSGDIDLSQIVKWVMVVRATDDEIYDVSPGATINGEFVEPDEFNAKLDAAIAKAKGPTILGMPAACSVHGAPKAAPKEDEEEDSFEEECKRDHEKHEKKCGPIIPGGAIVEYVNDKYFNSIERTTKAEMDKENKEEYEGKKFHKKRIAPGAKFVMVSCGDQEEFPVPVQSTITFPKGGTCYAYDFGEGYSCDQSIWVEDNVGNIWSIAGEPSDITDGAEEYIDDKAREELLERTGGTVILMQV